MKNIIEPFEDSTRESAPGFSETRRRMLWLPASIAASVMLDRAGKVFAVESSQEESLNPLVSSADRQLNWAAFLKQCAPVAEELHKDSSAAGQEAYLHWIASMIVRARTSDIPRAKVARFGKLEPAVSFGVGYRGKPFFIVEWQLEPGACLPPHCHPNASVCTLGLEGEARIRNFEVVGQAPEFSSRKTFLVRETHNEVIAPGRINALSSLRDNIHTFQAGRTGARGIDISTYHGPDIGFSFLDIATTPNETERRIFEAAWKGQTV
jgi:hypothetical protein